MSRPPAGFVPLTSLKRGPAPAPQAVLAEIRTIYFTTTRETIEHDLAHAVELLKSIAQETDREKATVYMHGLAEMQREWRPAKKPGRRRAAPR